MGVAQPATLGVDEDARALVRRLDAGIRRAKHAPLRIEPEAGQVCEYGTKDATTPRAEEAADVFKKTPCGFNLAKALDDVGPNPPLVGDASAFASEAVRLARESRNDAMNDAAPRCAVKGGDICPDRCRMKVARFHAARKDFNRVRFPFHVKYRSSARNRHGDAEIEAAAAGAEGSDMEGGM